MIDTDSRPVAERRPVEPLRDVRVIDLTRILAGPYATMILGDLGADVVKVELPGHGDDSRHWGPPFVAGTASYYTAVNRNKRSIAIDLKHEQGRDLVYQMLGDADLLVSNFRPGVMDRLGFGHARLADTFPGLIRCSITGHAPDDPRAQLPSFDLLIQAETGLCAVTGTPDGPGRVGVSVCDIAAGMNALAAIFEALYQRERTGKGAGIKVSLFDGMADWMTVPYLYQVHTGSPPPRLGLNHPSVAPYGAYPAGDGKPVLVSIQNEREWRNLCAEIFERPEVATDPRFVTPSKRAENRAALDEIVRDSFARWPRDELMERLRAARVACGALNDVADLARHPQLRTITLDAPSGPATVIAPPPIFAGEHPEYRAVPRVGEHSEAIRAEFSQ